MDRSSSSRAPSRQTLSSIGGTLTLVDAPVYPHSSTVQSSDLEITIQSPHLELVFPNQSDRRPISVPVFTTRDSIGGSVSLNPETCPISSKAKLTISLEGAFRWSTLAPPPTTTTKRPVKKQSTLPATHRPPVEHKHVFLYSSMDLSLADPHPSDASPGNLNGKITDPKYTTQAMAAIRRRMSYGKADAKAMHKRKQSAGDVVFPDPPPFVNGRETPVASTKVTKKFLFHLPLQGDRAMPPSFNLKQEALEYAQAQGGKTECKLFEDARVEYKLTARWESGGSLHLWSHLDAPLVFEPGSDPESFYAVPRKVSPWSEYALQPSAPSKESPPPFPRSSAPTPGSKPINPVVKPTKPIIESPSPPLSPVPGLKFLLTLPQPCIIPRDSRDPSLSDKAQPPEALKFYIAFATSPLDLNLIQRLRNESHIRLELACTYSFDKSQAAALTLGPGAAIAAGGKEVWKWNETPNAPLASSQPHARRGSSAGFGPGGGASAAATTTRTGASRTEGPKSGKRMPTVPSNVEEKTVSLKVEERKGFPHRAKEKPGQTNAPNGLWKSGMIIDWWMLPSMDWAGLYVKYHLTATVTFEGVEYKTRKSFRIVEPHTFRQSEPIPLTKKIELDGYV